MGKSGATCDVLQEDDFQQQSDGGGNVVYTHLLQKRAMSLPQSSGGSSISMTSEGFEDDVVTMDHNGKLCMLCSKPRPERVNKTYPEFRKDCGSKSSPTGPAASDLSKPVMAILEEAGATRNNSEVPPGHEKSGFCELNFAKSCADAVANRDYMYWAKSLDLRDPRMLATATWDARYCRENGFLEKEVVALQHDFEGLRALGKALCATKYAKYGIDQLSFIDMMTHVNYDDPAAPNQEDAELLAAWNCAMGDISCDIAMCAYSYCKHDDGSVGLYDECRGWHPVHGMPIE